MKKLAASLVAAFALVGLTACSGSLSASDVEKEIKAQVEKSGGKVEDIKCDDGLKAEVGATTKCTLTVVDKGAGPKIGMDVNATVSKVDGRQVNFTIKPVEGSVKPK